MHFFSLLFSAFFLTGCSFSAEKIEQKPLPEKNILEEAKENEKTFEQLTFPILKIVDGDTIWVKMNGKKEKIRFVGIDTPETEKEFTPVECYADEAEDRLRELLQGKKVALLQNKKGDERDKYGRLLRYVFADGEDIGAKLIEEGYAFAFRRYPHDRMNMYIQKEAEAKKKKRGMWNPENCSYW